MKAVVRTLDELDAFSANAARHGVFQGKPLTVSLVPFHTPKSTDQNKKMHAMFRDLASLMDFTADEVKNYFKVEFGPSMLFVLPNGVERQLPKSVSDYSVKDCKAMIKHIYEVGGQCGCVFSEGKKS